jgi:hypothetical protein
LALLSHTTTVLRYMRWALEGEDCMDDTGIVNERDSLLAAAKATATEGRLEEAHRQLIQITKREPRLSKPGFGGPRQPPRERTSLLLSAQRLNSIRKMSGVTQRAYHAPQARNQPTTMTMPDVYWGCPTRP